MTTIKFYNKNGGALSSKISNYNYDDSTLEYGDYVKVLYSELPDIFSIYNKKNDSLSFFLNEDVPLVQYKNLINNTISLLFSNNTDTIFLTHIPEKNKNIKTLLTLSSAITNKNQRPVIFL